MVPIDSRPTALRPVGSGRPGGGRPPDGRRAGRPWRPGRPPGSPLGAVGRAAGGRRGRGSPAARPARCADGPELGAGGQREAARLPGPRRWPGRLAASRFPAGGGRAAPSADPSRWSGPPRAVRAQPARAARPRGQTRLRRRRPGRWTSPVAAVAGARSGGRAKGAAAGAGATTAAGTGSPGSGSAGRAGGTCRRAARAIVRGRAVIRRTLRQPVAREANRRRGWSGPRRLCTGGCPGVGRPGPPGSRSPRAVRTAGSSRRGHRRSAGVELSPTNSGRGGRSDGRPGTAAGQPRQVGDPGRHAADRSSAMIEA